MKVTLEDIVLRYPDPEGGQPRTILDIPSLSLDSGAQLCLVGASGQGKTTLLHLMAGLRLPTQGRVLLGDTDLTRLAEAQRDVFRARHVGVVFQNFNLLPTLSALENVALMMTLASHPRRVARARAEALLERVGLSHRRHARPGVMSVGERQRVALARAVAARPGLVLADEPTANLDPERSEAALTLLQEVVAEVGSTLVLVTHEADVQARFQRVLPLSEVTR